MLDKLAQFADKYNMFPPEGLILVAVSGGADSMCLLTALLELSDKCGFSVAAAHFNHQLRGDESARDERFVERFCQDTHVKFYIGGGDVGAYARSNGLGIEEAARQLRYNFFYETANNIDAKRIATAHTADDNAETVLLNLTRGAGLNGLGGIPPIRDMIIRPMLTVTRNDVTDFLTHRHISFVEDSSNNLDIYSRNRIRHHIIPVLREINPRLMDHITTSTDLIREDEAYLSSIAELFIHDNCRDVSCDAMDVPNTRAIDAHALAGLPRPVSSRVIRLIYGNNLSSEHISAVLALCKSDSVSGEVALPSGCAFREYDRIVLTHGVQTTGFSPVEINIDDKIDIPELKLTVKCLNKDRSDICCSEKINKSFTSFLFKYDSICGKIIIRPRQTGDKIDLFGRNNSKTLKKLFIEQRIPRRLRPLVPVITDDKGVLAVYGIGTDERAAWNTAVADIDDKIIEIIFEETSYEK